MSEILTKLMTIIFIGGYLVIALSMFLEVYREAVKRDFFGIMPGLMIFCSAVISLLWPPIKIIATIYEIRKTGD